VEYDRRGVSTAVGLTLSGKLFKRHFRGSLHSEQVIVSLQHLLRQLPRGFVLIWDRASIHKSKATQGFLRAHPEIRVEVLPAYAPDLNPEEYCHGNVKARVRNATPGDVRQVQHLLDRGFARLRRRPDLLLHFFHAAGLPVRQLW
jgi:transposase